jgi:hypothetical protein
MSHFLLTLRLTRSLQCFLICFLALPRAPTMGYSNLGGKKRELVERPPTGIKNRERECCKQTRANSMPDRSVIRVLTPPDWLTDWQTDWSLDWREFAHWISFNLQISRSCTTLEIQSPAVSIEICEWFGFIIFQLPNDPPH